MAAVQMQRLERVAAIQATMAAAAELESQANLALDLDDIADDEDVVIEIERLLTLGVPQSDIARLKSAGIVTVAGALMTSRKVRICFAAFAFYTPLLSSNLALELNGHKRIH